MSPVRSIVFSIVATTVATLATRGILSVSQPLEEGKRPRLRGGPTVVVVVPILAGNSNNRIGVKEVHHHHHPLFGRGGR